MCYTLNMKKESNIIPKKDSVIKKTENGIITEKIFKKEVSKLATKDELKKEVSKLATKDELKKEVAKLATKDELKNQINRLDKKIEDQTETLMGAIESLNNVLYKMEVNAEKEREENKVFREGFINHEKKIQDLDKRVFLLEEKVL